MASAGDQCAAWLWGVQLSSDFGRPWPHAGRVRVASIVSHPTKGVLGGLPFPLPGIALLSLSCQGNPKVLATQ